MRFTKTNYYSLLFIIVLVLAAVNEDAPNGTIVVKLEAKDDDLLDQTSKTYYISDGNSRGHFR